MKVYITAAMAPYYDRSCRVYEKQPSLWDGSSWVGEYTLMNRSLLLFLGLKEFPAQGSRAILEVELTARVVGYPVPGMTEVME